jgi:hypothetical protein
MKFNGPVKVCFVFVSLLLFNINLFSYTQEVSVGPLAYYMKRQRDNYTQQGGELYGLSANWQRLKNNAIYLGGFFDVAEGNLYGYTGSGSPLKSLFTDMDAEAQIGYTFFCTGRICAQFSPFIGVGYLQQTNKFLPPSSNTFKFVDRVQYGSFGFYWTNYFTSRFSTGLKITLKPIYKAKCFVSNDPSNDNVIQLIDEKMFVTVEIPITYSLFNHSCRYKFTITPFYDYRDFGGRFNYPYDFIRTTYNSVGARLLVDIAF